MHPWNEYHPKHYNPNKSSIRIRNLNTIDLNNKSNSEKLSFLNAIRLEYKIKIREMILLKGAKPEVMQIKIEDW